jgi:hypothetical protein
MGEFKDRLDAEARRVAAEPDALASIKDRARRRRVRRQVGSGVAALAVAGAGFAVAVVAFRGGPLVGPAVGPSVSPSSQSPQWWRPIVVVEGPAQLQDDINDLSGRLQDDGYNVEWKAFVQGMPVNDHTVIQYKPAYLEDAAAIREDVVPVVMFDAVSWPDNRPDIEITIGADYRELLNGFVQVRVLDAGGGEGATDAAADMLAAAGYDIVEVGGDSELLIKAGAIVACAPNHDEEGFRILEEFFPDAHFRGELPSADHDVTVYIGPEVNEGAGAGN